jgi:hypothetical protein
MTNKSIKYNHDRTLSDFQNSIDIIIKAGFKPIAVTQMYLEDTFVFKTSEEANKAYKTLERGDNEKFIGKVVGWWYGEDDFKKTVEEYETENNGYSKVKIYYIND